MVGSKKKEWRLAFKRSSPFLISATLSGIVFGALVIAGGLRSLMGWSCPALSTQAQPSLWGCS